MRSLLLLATATILSSSLAIGQGLTGNSLYLRGDGENFGVIFQPPTGLLSNQIFNLPSQAGTLVTTGSLPTVTWMLGGNALVSPGPLDNQLGSTDAANVELIANGSARLVLVQNAAATLVPDRSEIRFAEPTATGTHYVGLQAPADVTASYTISLPVAAPTAGQVLRATSATATEWVSFDEGNGVGVTFRNANIVKNSDTYEAALTGAVAANTNYEFQISFSAGSNNANADPEFEITAPAGSTIEYGYTASNGTVPGGYSTLAGADHMLDIGNGDLVLVVIRGLLSTAGTAGNLVLNVRQRTGGGGNTTFYAGAALKIMLR